MLTADWESSPGALAALLNGAGGGASAELLDMVDLYTITLAGGQVLRYTAGDAPKTVGANTWQVGPIITRSRLKWGLGITVDTLTMTVAADDSVQVAGMPLMRYIAAGGLAGADVLLQRLFAAPFAATPTGLLHRFGGRVADIGGHRYERSITVRSHTELLDKMIPADVFQPGCKNDVFDPQCGLSAAAFTVAGAATGASNATRTAFAHALGQAAGHFNLGVLVFTSGPNAGIKRTVRQHQAGQMVLAAPLPFAVAVGHTFTVRPGCDKTMANCQALHGDPAFRTAFRGEPFIPAPDTVV